MIDIHSHIIFGIDDGAKDLQESLALLRLSQQQGVTHVVATPHIHLGRYNNTKMDIFARVAKLQRELHKAGLTIKIAPAAEVRLDSALIAQIEHNQLPFIGYIGAKRYLLLELPHSHMPIGFEKFIQWLGKKGIKTVIPHPERNRDIQKDRGFLNKLKQLGCQFQLTAGSFLGDFGELPQQLSDYILTHNLADYVASDMHSVNRRPSKMSDAYHYVSQHFGQEKAHLLFYQNPKELTQALFIDEDINQNTQALATV